jgi:hypothetical protein
MGADVIVAGLQDAVVETMVELGMTLPNIHAVLDLDDALALSREYKAQEQEAGAIGSDQGESESAGLDALYADSALDNWTEV